MERAINFYNRGIQRIFLLETFLIPKAISPRSESSKDERVLSSVFPNHRAGLGALGDPLSLW